MEKYLRLHFEKDNNLNQLHDEILSKLPHLRETMIVEGRGRDVWLTLPSTTDELEQRVIDNVVTKHIARAGILLRIRRWFL